MADNEQIPYFSHADEVRKELTPKIDEKVSNNTFFTILGMFFAIFAAVIGYAFTQINTVNDKMQIVMADVAVLKSQIQNEKK